MEKVTFKKALLLSLVSGVVTSIAFPTRFGDYMLPNFGFVAWFSLVPFVSAISISSPRRSFVLGLAFGIPLYAVSLYWLYTALNTYGGIPPFVSILILALLILFLASYMALAVSIGQLLHLRLGIPLVLALPVTWTMLEFLRGHFPFGGFPWNNIAHTQARYPLLIQTASIFGTYGITFLIILFNAALAEVVLKRWRGKVLLKNLGAVVLILLLSILYGWHRLISSTYTERESNLQQINVALVQGNIPQDEKWDSMQLEENLKVYSDVTSKLARQGIDLIVWPESAYPFLFLLTKDKIDPQILGLDSQGPRPWLLFGALSSYSSNAYYGYYNSAILIDSGGTVKGAYHKVHLVPFGEYVPMRKLLFFAKAIASQIGDLKRGDDYNPLTIGDTTKIAPLICFEDVFPEIARHFVKNGAELLVNITNDAWYGRSSAAYQHLAISIFRAVETKRYLLRAANTGITAVIDPYGRLVMASSIYDKAIAISKATLLDYETAYVRFGDILPYACIAIVLASLVILYGKKYLLNYVIKCKGR